MSGKAKALIGIARFLISVGFGYGVYYYWYTLRIVNSSHPDPEYYAISAGVMGTLVLYFMLTQIKGGGD
jgi:hypothetical protein